MTAPQILVIEDDPENTPGLVDLLTDQGWHVQLAQDGKTALAKLSQVQPDLILLAALLPDRDGLDVCQHLKAEPGTAEIPVIFLTRLTDSFDRERGFLLGGADYITKPFQREEVLTRIQTHLRLRQLTQQLVQQNVSFERGEGVSPLLGGEAPNPPMLQNLVFATPEAQTTHLQARDQQLTSIINNIPGGVYRAVYDADYRLTSLFLSDGYRDLLGIDPHTVMAQPDRALELIHPDDVQRFVTALRQGGETLEPIVLEYRLLTVNGDYRWISDNARFTRGVQGELIVNGVDIDISERQRLEAERQQAELALQASEAQLTDILNGTHLSSIVRFRVFANYDWEYDYQSPGCEALFGYTADEIVADKHLWMSHVLPEDRETVLMPVFASIMAERTTTVEFRYQHKQGDRRWISATYTSRYDAVANCWLVTGVSTDITSQKQVESRLRDSEMRLRLALDISGAIAWERDLQTDQLWFTTTINPEMPTTLSYGEALSLVHPADREALQLANQTAIAQRGAFQFEHRILAPGLSPVWRWVQVSARVLTDGAGNPNRMIGMSIDVTDRKQAEALVRESEERLRLVIEATNDAVWDWVQATNHVWWGKGFQTVFGYDLTTIPHTLEFWLDQIHPEDLSTFLTAYNTAIKKRQNAWSVEHRFRRANKTWAYVLNRGYVLLGERGEASRCIGAITDISDRKRAADLVQQSEAALAQAQRIAHIGNWQYNVISQETRWSEEMYHIFGLSPGQPAPSYEAMLDYLHPADAALWQRQIERAISEGADYEFDCRILRPDGSLRYLEARGEVMWNSQQWITCLFGTVLDITDRKQMELTLQEREYLLRTLGNNIPNGAIYQLVQEPDGQIYFSFISAGIERLTGIHPNAILQDPSVLYNLIVDEDRQLHDERMTESKQNLSIFEMQMRKRTPHGSIQWSYLRSAPRQMPDGRVVWDGIEMDITDLKEAELELQQAKEASEAANRAKSIFLANMSHELRTPLNIILGYAQLMSHDPSLKPEQQEYLRTIHRSGDHLLSLINDVLNLSKIEAGRITLEETGVDLFNLLCTLRDMFQQRAAAKGLQFTLELEPDVPPYVITDGNKLRQVLINLLSNAVKFTQNGGIWLRVSLFRGEMGQVLENNYPQTYSSPEICCVQFDVSDTGVGIATEEMETIFDAFAQAQAGRKTSEGTGLGLAISQKFVNFMGGVLSVTSAPNQGSTFRVQIPVRLADASQVPALVPNVQVVGLVPGQPPYRMLVVDDHPANCQLLMTLLGRVGFQVKQTANGEDAIRLWQEWQPDLIWMDLRIPGIDGYETTRRIRQLETLQLEQTQRGNGVEVPPLPTTKIIAFTAQVFADDRDRALAIGCDDFVTKPVQESVLFDIIATHLGVQYLYAGAPSAAENSTVQSNVSPDAKQPVPSQMNLQPADLSSMPVDWINALYQAALNCYADEVNALIQQIPSHETNLINGLKQLNHDYQFEVIMHLSDIQRF